MWLTRTSTRSSHSWWDASLRRYPACGPAPGRDRTCWRGRTRHDGGPRLGRRVPPQRPGWTARAVSKCAIPGSSALRSTAFAGDPDGSGYETWLRSMQPRPVGGAPRAAATAYPAAAAYPKAESPTAEYHELLLHCSKGCVARHDRGDHGIGPHAPHGSRSRTPNPAARSRPSRPRRTDILHGLLGRLTPPRRRIRSGDWPGSGVRQRCWTPGRGRSGARPPRRRSRRCHSSRHARSAT